jgi:polysaccharide biosynthesis/export protein
MIVLRSRTGVNAVCRIISSILLFSSLISCTAWMLPGSKKADDFAGPESGDYVLGPEDKLEIVVWGNEKLSREVIVRPDGKISLPLIGEVQVGGYSAPQLQQVISKKLAEYKETPEVAVIVKEINSYSIFVMGEVARPGKYVLKTKTSVLQAIAIAGGFTQWASKNRISVIRAGVDGKESRIRVKYSRILSKGAGEDLILRSGDTVIVP